MTDTVVKALRKYADKHRDYAENSRIVADLLKPQVDLFDARYMLMEGELSATGVVDDRENHNTYAVRMGIEHRKEAESEEAFAAELDLAADLIDMMNAPTAKTNAHKNAQIVIAWVCGAVIEYQSPSTDEWMTVTPANALCVDNDYLEPNPLHPDYDYFTYRVKAG